MQNIINYFNKYIMMFVLFIIVLCLIINFTIGLSYINYFTNNISSKIIKYYTQIITLYNLTRPVESFDSNPKYLKASNIFKRQDFSNEGFLLRDFYITGSANSIVFQRNYNTFVSLTAIETVLKLGARTLELNIFNSAFNNNRKGIPVCASNDTKLSHLRNSIATFNYISLFNVCETIKANAFLNSITDPLFLILNLNFSPKY